MNPESGGRRGQTQTWCQLQNIALAQREPAVLTGSKRLRLCWLRPREVVRQEVSPAPEAVHLSGPYKDTAPRVSASTSFKAREQSAAEIALQLLFCQSGEGIRKPGANLMAPVRLWVPLWSSREMEDQARGVTGLITPPLKSIPVTQQLPELVFQFPLHPLQRTALTLSVIYAVLRGNHKPDSMTSASSQPSRPLTAPLPGSIFQNLFAFAVPCSQVTSLSEGKGGRVAEWLRG